MPEPSHPSLGAALQVFLLSIGLWLLNTINFLEIGVITSFYSIISSNLHWFFAAFVIIGYGDYAKATQKNYWVVSPLFDSFKIVFSLWIVTLLIELVSMFSYSSALLSLNLLFYSNITSVFMVFLMLLYAAAFVGKIIEVIE